jgi:hypothetical protein
MKPQIQNYTDKKEKQNFLIYAISYHMQLTASSYVTKYLRISSYIMNPFPIYYFATAPIWISSDIRKILFYFLSV